MAFATGATSAMPRWTVRAPCPRCRPEFPSTNPGSASAIWRATALRICSSIPHGWQDSSKPPPKGPGSASPRTRQLLVSGRRIPISECWISPGNGRSDALMTRDQQFLWFPCLGEKGFGPPQSITRSHDLDQFPDVFFDDPAGRVRRGDMTGDGLNDIVTVGD